jgi:Ca-activated chloride channel family protein
MKAVRAALEPSRSQTHIRVVCFMTDGYVGNDDEIIQAIRTYPNARVFSFGIGESVNRYLLDRMAREGRGEVEYVSLRDDGSAAARRFHERVRNPVLTDINVEWGTLPVSDVLPARIPDLFSAKPVVIAGRYKAAAKGIVKLRGKLAGAPWSRDIPLDLPAAPSGSEALATLWARMKVDSLAGISGSEEQIVELGLSYRLVTPFTSFVAVEETVVTEGGKPRRVYVPIEIPEGVSHEGIFGEASMVKLASPGMVTQAIATPSFMPSPARGWHSGTGTVWKVDPKLARSKGVIRVQLWVRATDQATLHRIKQLGFVITAQPKGAKTLIGTVDAAKLQMLAALDTVTWIAPAP